MRKINIPTALSLRETNLLRKLSHGKKVLEIGSLLGYSTINLAMKAKSVTSIDPHKDYPYHGSDSTFNKFIFNLRNYNIYNVNPIVDIFDNVKIDNHDMAFIDLDGKYETTKKALKATQHIPLVVIHDFQRQNCSGIEKAIKEYKTDIITSIDTCIMIDNRRKK